MKRLICLYPTSTGAVVEDGLLTPICDKALDDPHLRCISEPCQRSRFDAVPVLSHGVDFGRGW